MAHKYNYRVGRKAAEINGLTIIDSWLDQADEVFARAKLTQAQVDAMMAYHCHVVRHMFTPSIYTFRQRVKLAFLFLFGR